MNRKSRNTDIIRIVCVSVSVPPVFGWLRVPKLSQVLKRLHLLLFLGRTTKITRIELTKETNHFDRTDISFATVSENTVLHATHTVCTRVIL